MAVRIHTDFAETEVEDFRSLKGNPGPLNKGLFIAEGPKIARKVLESSIEVPSAFMTESHFKELNAHFERLADEMNVFIAKKEEMERVVGYHLHQGIMLAAKIPANRNLSQSISEWNSPWTAVALDGIADAENMGAIIRNAAAFGARAIIVDDQSCNPYLRRSVRVSMGTIVDLDIISVPDLPNALKEMKSFGVHIVGAVLGANAVPLQTVKRSERTVLVFGSEGWGLRSETKVACDTLTEIPISEKVDSLNVAVACGIFLYEITRWKINSTGT